MLLQKKQEAEHITNKHLDSYYHYKKYSKILCEIRLLTLMLPVQWIGLTQPHQTDEQHHRPQNLHHEADLNRDKVIHMLGTYTCHVPINTQILTYGNLKAYV